MSPPRLGLNLMQGRQFHAMVGAQGRVPSTEVISARLQPASAAVCAWLQFPALSSVVQICRVPRIYGAAGVDGGHVVEPEGFAGDWGFSCEQLYA